MSGVADRYSGGPGQVGEREHRLGFGSGIEFQHSIVLCVGDEDVAGDIGRYPPRGVVEIGEREDVLGVGVRGQLEDSIVVGVGDEEISGGVDGHADGGGVEAAERQRGPGR